MIELFELHYTKSELARAPEKDRLFYLMATGLANHLQTLMKLFAVAVDEQRDELIIKQGGSAVGMLMLRLLAGRLWEGWQLICSAYNPIEANYESAFSPETFGALAELRAYFTQKRNLMNTVRDKIGFHADKGIVKRALERLPDDTDMGDYLCRTVGNTLYFSAELLHYEAIHGFTRTDDQLASLQKLVGDVQLLVGHFNTFIFGFAAIFLSKHLSRQLGEMRTHKTVLDGVPSLAELELPYFTQFPNRTPGNNPSRE
jgi:hypothetical protein